MRGLAAAAVILWGCIATPAASPSPTTSPIPIAASPPSPTFAPVSPSPAPFVGSTYRIALPSPWRRATCVGFSIFAAVPGATPSPTLFSDTFVAVREGEETQSDVGFSLDVIFVRAERTGPITPRAYVDRGSLGAPRDLKVDDVTLDGRPAVLVRSGIVAGAPAGIADVTYAVADGPLMYSLGYRVQTRTTDPAAAERGLTTFHILSAAERVSPAPTPLASVRSAQEVAQGLVDGFARRDADALAAFMAPCMAAFGERSGGINRPRSGFAAELRSSFAAGLTVDVGAAPASDQLGTYLAATWRTPGQPDQRRDLYLRDDGGGRWTWFLVLTRQPLR